ncbi:MAG: WG repeat-containing protein [Oscillospiraceae bacterium]|nr:WG repeat-containing protein [Oscillospiraceae bacterium]
MKKLMALIIAGLMLLSACGSEPEAEPIPDDRPTADDFQVVEIEPPDEPQEDFTLPHEDFEEIEDFRHYYNGAFHIFNSMLVLVRSNSGNDDLSGIYDGRTGELITPGYFFFRASHSEDINFWLNNDFAVISTGDWPERKYGHINKNGEIVVPLIYDDAGDFFGGVAQVALDGKSGFVNTSGEVIIPIIYDFEGWLDWGEVFHEDLAAVSIDGKWGFIDRSGEVIIPLEFDGAQQFYEGLAGVQRDGYWGFVNKSGEVVVDFEYARVNDFEHGVSVVQKGAPQVTGDEWTTWKSGLINREGEVLLPAEYDLIHYYGEGLFSVLIGNRGPQIGKWGFADTSGEIVIPIKYDDSRSFENGLAMVGVGNASTGNVKWGYINTADEVIIPLEYSWGWTLGEDLIGVSVGSNDDPTTKVYNRNGEVVFPAGAFGGYGKYMGDGVLWAGNDDKWGLINLDGEILLPLEYGWSSFFSTARATFSEGMTFLTKDGKWGFATAKGEIVVPLQYDVVNSFRNGFARVGVSASEDSVGYKFGFIDKTGEVVIPIEYNNAVYIGVENDIHYFWVQTDGEWEIIIL